jgi:hypothetical protein
LIILGVKFHFKYITYIYELLDLKIWKDLNKINDGEK